MGKAAARVLELFRQTPSRDVTGVTGVTHVTSRQVTPESPTITPVTQVTCCDLQPANTTAASALTERTGIIELDDVACRSCAEGLAQLDPSRPPADVPPQRWVQFIHDGRQFLDEGWPSRAKALGWSPYDLFGCDHHRPFGRVEHAGLLWLLNGRKLLALTGVVAKIATEAGGSLTYVRCPDQPGRVLPWELVPFHR
jgi:hypothetical protein